MLITHCPDPTLALLFQPKSPEDWTMAEVQSRLDSYVGKASRAMVSTYPVYGFPGRVPC